MQKLISLILLCLGGVTWLLADRSLFYDLILPSYLILIIICMPFLFRRLQWFEPIVAFNCMMLIFVLDVLYFALTGFPRAEHLLHGYFQVNELSWPLMLYVAGWLFSFNIGYALWRRSDFSIDADKPLVRIEGDAYGKFLRLAVIACILISVSNFIYNIWLFSPGDPLSYFIDFGVARYRQQVNDGWFTTLGYNFFIVGIILYRLTIRKWGWGNFISYISFILCSLLAFVSKGQIFFTFSVVIFLYLLECFVSSRRRQVILFGGILVPVLVAVVLLSYLLRVVSVDYYLAMEQGLDINVWSLLWDKLDVLSYLIFGKGNVPNLPAMFVYWDNYGSVDDYLNGQSMFSWLYGFLPDLGFTFLGYHIRDLWYPNHVGGIPPGVILEFYANFGVLLSVGSAMVFGAIASWVFNAFMERRTVVFCVLYSALLVRFWFILPKLEMAALSSALWLSLPTVCALKLISFANEFCRKKLGSA